MTWMILQSQHLGEEEYEPRRDPDWAGLEIHNEAITSMYVLIIKSSFAAFFSRALQHVVCIVSVSELDSPFSRWSKEQVCEWLQKQGLDLYVNQAQQCISSGQTLLKASQHDLEKVFFKKNPYFQICMYFYSFIILGYSVQCMMFLSVLQEMGIRHPLHRKKLQLALQSLGSEEDDTMGKLDYNWVTRK